jgi:lysozyme family protein
MTLATAMKFTLGAEGGFTHDNGGDTMNGVTQGVYDAYRRMNNEHLQTVRVILPEEVADIMESGYWTPAHCGDLTEKMGVAHFDWSYNHGQVGAIRMLQGVVGVMVDGQYGGVTKRAAQAMGDDAVAPYLKARRDWYNDIAAVHPETYGRYLKGWLNRVDNLEEYLKGL